MIHSDVINSESIHRIGSTRARSKSKKEKTEEASGHTRLRDREWNSQKEKRMEVNR